MTNPKHTTVDVLVIRDYLEGVTVQDRSNAIEDYNKKYGLLPGIIVDSRSIGYDTPQELVDTMHKMFTRPHFRVESFDWETMTAQIQWSSPSFDLSKCYLCLCYLNNSVDGVYTIERMMGCYLSPKEYNDNVVELTPRPQDHKINPNEVVN